MSSDYPLVIRVPRQATLPPGELSSSDVIDILTRLGVLEGGLELGQLNKVNLDGLADGDVIVYDEDNDEWVPATQQAGIEVYANAVEVLPEAIGLNFHPSLSATVSGMDGGPKGDIAVAFAGTGSASTSARSDHTHTAAPFTLATGAATGVLSSGTRTLRNQAGPTLASGIDYDIDGAFVVRGRNNVNSGTLNLLCRIGASGTYPQRTRVVQTVGGVPVDQIVHFRAVLTGAGSGVTEYFAVQHASGDATDIRDWEIDISYSPRR